MRQFTTFDQTAKLIELGFEKPKALVDKYYDFDSESYVEVKAYSIGELIEILPKELECASLQLYHAGLWSVSYPLLKDKYYVASFELCDSLCDMICYLKEKGVI